MKTKIIVLAAAAALALTACGSAASSDQAKIDKWADRISVQYVSVDGNTIPCIVWVGSEAGAISCDWN